MINEPSDSPWDAFKQHRWLQEQKQEKLEPEEKRYYERVQRFWKKWKTQVQRKIHQKRITCRADLLRALVQLEEGLDELAADCEADPAWIVNTKKLISEKRGELLKR